MLISSSLTDADISNIKALSNEKLLFVIPSEYARPAGDFKASTEQSNKPDHSMDVLKVQHIHD